MSVWQYFCICGRDAAYPLKVDPTWSFSKVRDNLYGSTFRLKYIDHGHLDLYTPSNLKREPLEGLAERADNSIDGLLPHKLNDNVLDALGVHMSDGSLIHFVVKEREPPVLGKHSRSSIEEDTFVRMTKTKIATEPPSSFARLSRYESIQVLTSEKILDDRPEPDQDIPPIALLYDGFGHFLDICRGRTDVPGLDDVDRGRLEAYVDGFADRLCRPNDSQFFWKDLRLHILDKIFCQRSGFQIPRLMQPPLPDSDVADGRIIGDHGGPAFVVDFEKECADNSTIPAVEVTSYVAHINKKCLQDVFRGWRVPSLGLTIIGTDVAFYAIIAIDHQYRVVHLTSTLSCIPTASDGDDRKKLYAAFTAALVLIPRILQDGTKFQESPPPVIPHALRRFPAVTKLPKYGADGHVEFQIQKFYPDRRGYRSLYIAEMKEEKKEIIVKFTRQYSIELHALCAEHGHAPGILGFARLPGGWYAVAMEYISPAVLFTSGMVTIDAEQRKKDLRTIVGLIHDKGFVHGDLRDVNIIYDNQNRLMLLDFDWGGKEGDVSYPTSDLNEELLRGRPTTDDLKISKNDDKRVLQITMGKL